MGGRREVGTGVTISIGERAFVATAAHVVEDAIEIMLIWGEADSQNPVPIKNSNHDKAADIAYLEVPMPGSPTCRLDQLVNTEWDRLRQDAQAWLVGMPKDHCEYEPHPSADSKSETFRITMSKRCSGMKYLEFHDNRLLFDYPATGIRLKGGKEQEVERDHPEGYSGCGVWGLLDRDDTTIWTPQHNIALFGIEHRWNPKKRYVVATPILTWLEMIHEDYPDLRAEIEASRIWEKRAINTQIAE